MFKFLCAVLLSVCPAMSAWAATIPLKVLIFSKTAAYRHASIPAGISAIEELGALRGWDVDATEDASQFNDSNLERYDVVVWLNTSGNILDSQQKEAYERFQQSHKGTVAIHEAGTDTERDNWPWYRKMASVLLSDHPEIQKATVLLQDQAHPASFTLPLQWEHVDEWYSFVSDPRLDPDVHVLASVDERTYDPGELAMGKGPTDHPLTWYKHYDGGRYFYTALGHTYEDYRSDRYFRALLTGAIEWAAGRKPDHLVRDTDEAALIFKEFDGKSSNGVWDRQGPPQPANFKYAVKPDALEMYANTPLNQHLVREGIAIDPSRPYAIEGKFVIPRLGDDANSFCVNLNVAGPDGDVSNVNTWALNVDLHQEGGAVIKFMGFVDGRFTQIGQVETNWGAADTEYQFRMYVNADYDGHFQSKRVSMFVMKGDTQLEKLMVDYSSFPYQPDGAKSVRLGVNTHEADWVLRDLKVYYLDVPQRVK
ncbi:MAG TPA: ThuA domain-containing protein [Terriglobales bacterium]|nr:ThuA domain-containing protein [Terriglobales bacterium]